ncbi:hypothetical protein EJ08DRAFT_690260 [Tothia fuscella]|uniref:Uncharacterized protein n=1 Tax=Tothia fuscella TaxID=1048955 RepID=A0A9P4NGZ3_9PEZI|nr:hypothetical protein EJ08DRAFT_690260 [Tothia fuscella]
MSTSILPPRFEVRRLEEKDIPFITALATHSALFHSPVWSKIYPENKTERAMLDVEVSYYPTLHSVQSGMSFGVFDQEYENKTPEAAATEGGCYWNPDNTSANDEELLAQMDFPLVSIALGYDAYYEMDTEKLGDDMAKVLPLFSTVDKILDTLDKRPYSERMSPTHHQMYAAQRAGFKTISIVTMADAVRHVWLNALPAKPFTAEVVAEFDMGVYVEREQETGEMVRVFAPATQRVCRVLVRLL